MDDDLYTFVIVLPRNMARIFAPAMTVTVQLNVDATDVMQATVGANYIRAILTRETNGVPRSPRLRPVPRRC